jgi:hypothetical protein
MDIFNKFFLYIFALVITLSTYIYDICFFFIIIPKGNEHLIYTIAGVLNSTCLITIINFFYGSSKQSVDKSEQITTLINKPSNGQAKAN